MYVIVAVVYKIASKRRLREVLHILWHKGIIKVEHVAPLALFYLCLVGYLAVGSIVFFLVFNNISREGINLGLNRHIECIGVGTLDRTFCPTLLLNRLRRGILIATTHYNQIGYWGWYLESILVLNQGYVLALKTCYLTTTYIAKELYLVSYFHRFLLA